jgi:hypothetical protein
MWMNVPEDWTTVAVILNVLTLLEVFYADVTMDTPEMAWFVLVGVPHYYSLTEISNENSPDVLNN